MLLIYNLINIRPRLIPFIYSLYLNFSEFNGIVFVLVCLAIKLLELTGAILLLILLRYAAFVAHAGASTLVIQEKPCLSWMKTYILNKNKGTLA